MTTYRAVVKYALDASDDEKVKALKQGVSDIAMELVGEHGLDAGELERVFEDAEFDAQQKDDREESLVTRVTVKTDKRWVALEMPADYREDALEVIGGALEAFGKTGVLDDPSLSVDLHLLYFDRSVSTQQKDQA